MGDLSVQIRAALGAFASESQQQGRRLRDLLDASPPAFTAVVRGMLLEARDTPELRYVVALLSSRGLLLGLLKELSLEDRGAAGVVAQLAQGMDPGFVKVLARSSLAAREQSAPDPEFLMGILEALTDGFNLLPLLGSLRHSGDPRVRSRLATMLGKTARAHEWFNGLRTDPDPRVRANAVESLWTVGGSYADACFAAALEDPHHRVTANALVGQYMQGKVESIRLLAEMSRHEEARFRAAAAWAMGRTGDPRFVPLLRSLRKHSGDSPVVVRNSLQAISKITHGLATAERRRLKLRVLGTGGAVRPDGEVWEAAAVLVRAPGLVELPEVRDTAWMLEAEGHPVWQYAVERIEAPGRMACCFLLPAGAADTGRATRWQALVEEFAQFRRQNDSGAVRFYAEAPQLHFSDRTGEILKISEDAAVRRKVAGETGQLLGDSARLLAAAGSVPEARSLPEGPLGQLLPLTALLGATHGGRHVFLVLGQLKKPVWDKEELTEAADALRERGVVLHGFAVRSTAAEARAAFGRLCRESGGVFLEAPTLEEVSSDARDTVASLYRRYRLAFPGSGEGRRKVEVQGAGYEGSVEWHCEANAAAA